MKQYLLDPEWAAVRYPEIKIKAGDLFCLPPIVLTFTDIEIEQAIKLARDELPPGVKVGILEVSSPYLSSFDDDEKPFQFAIINRESRPATAKETLAIIEGMKQSPNTLPQ